MPKTMTRIAATCGVVTVALGGLAAGVAQGGGSRQAAWVTFEEVWILEVDEERTVFLPADVPEDDGTEQGAPDDDPAAPVADVEASPAPDEAPVVSAQGVDRDRDRDRHHHRDRDRRHHHHRDRDRGGRGDHPVEEEPDGTDPVSWQDAAAFFPPPGSRFFYTDKVHRSVGRGFQAGDRIGDEGGQFDFGVDRALATVSFELWGRGTIEASFAFSYVEELAAPTDPAPPYALAITGGTGDFKGITGEITIYDDTDANDPDDLLGKAVIDALLPRQR